MTTPEATVERRVEYVRLDELQFADVNPREHDLEALRRSVEAFGFTEPGLLDERTGRLVAGHGRAGVLALMHAEGAPAPSGVQLHPDGAWAIPIIRGWASSDDRQAEAYLIASNKLTERSGWEEGDLARLLRGLDEDLREAAGFDAEETAELLARLEAAERDYGGGPAGPPGDFPGFGDELKGEYQCPSCHYEWSGQPR